MTKRVLILPVAMISLYPSSALVAPSLSLVRLRLTSTTSSCRDKDYFRLSFRDHLRVSQVPPRRSPGRCRVCMMAKKKKGPAADALAQLEALEAAEAIDSETTGVAVGVEKRPSPPKKGKKKGPAADALAQLEALEASGALEAQNVKPKGPPAVEAAPIVDERPLPQPPRAASAAQEHAEAMLIEPAHVGTNGRGEARSPADMGREKAKGKIGTTGGQVQYNQVPADASATPVVKKDAEGILAGPDYAGDAENGKEVLEMHPMQPGGHVKKSKKGEKGVDFVTWDDKEASQGRASKDKGDISEVSIVVPVESEEKMVEQKDEDKNTNPMQPMALTGKKAKKNNKGKDAKVPDELPGEVDAELLMPQKEGVASPWLLAVENLDEGGKVGEKQEETLEAKIRKNRPAPRVRISSTAQPGYVSLRLDGIAVTFRNQEVVKDATWEVKTGDRLGLVGPNGGGKTTQVKILAGDLQPTAGEVVKSSKDLCVAFLRQEFVDELVMHRSLKEELTSVFKEESEILNELQACEDELQDERVQQDPERMEKVLNRLSQLQEEAERRHVYDLGTKVQRMMDFMGFDISEGDHPISSFSGGWRMRIGLGKILLTDPNVILLDEPTNHLDMESVEWLERFLQNQNIPMVIVSHDREFLDRVCTGIVDMDGGVATSYPGNYSNFLKLKRARREAWEAAYRNQQKKIKEERNWINKFKTKGAWASQVKSREKALEKLIAGDDYVKQPPNSGKPFRFRFPPASRAGSEEILAVNGVSHGYAGRILFENVNFTVDKGDRIAFLGPNGAGKSTLLRLVVGQEDPVKGTCTLGSSVVKQYFEQNQADALDLSKTVIETMMGASTTEKYEDLRKLLGQFLFKGDAVEKSVEQLSGGEKARVALCKMMLTPANLLVLDEPTNHLDIPAKEMLEEALQHYEGAVLVVSHDRYFVSQVATTICNFEDNKLIRYDGDYRYFLERNDNMLEKVESRYVAGVDGIQKAKRVDMEQLSKSTKSFGGKGGPSGRKDKGIKNAKRHAEKVI